jgi:hypothetical protein
LKPDAPINGKRLINSQIEDTASGGSSEFRIQNSEFKEQIQRDSFDSVFGKLNHRLGMTPTTQQHLTP